jgi:hypothetical protein
VRGCSRGRFWWVREVQELERLARGLGGFGAVIGEVGVEVEKVEEARVGEGELGAALRRWSFLGWMWVGVGPGEGVGGI